MEPKTGHSSQGVLLVAALKFSVIAGNGPHVFFKPLQPSTDMGIFDCTEGGGAVGGAGLR